MPNLLAKITNNTPNQLPVPQSGETLVSRDGQWVVEQLNTAIALNLPPHTHTPVQVSSDPAGTASIVLTSHESGANHPIATQLAKGMMSEADKSKLDSVATGATKNAGDAELRNRTTHTGTQPIFTISGLQASLDGKQSISTILTALASLLSSGAIELKSDGTTTTFAVTPTAKALLDDADTPTMRSTLGLGEAATRNVGTTAATVLAGNAIAIHEGTTNHPQASVTTPGMMAALDKAKLDGIERAATKNDLDAALRNRSTHTGNQAIDTITGLSSALDNKQPLASNLTALAGTNSAGAIERATNGTYSTFAVTSAGKALIDDIDVITQRTTLGLGTAATLDAASLRDRSTHTGTQPISTISSLQAGLDSKQPIASNLTALAGTNSAGAIERDANGTYSTFVVTAAGKALIDDVDATAQRATLGLGTASVESATSLRDRSTHTGVQAIATITGLQTVLDTKQNVFTPQNANAVLVGPASGTAALPTYRNLASSDIPDLDFSKITTGTIPIARGGTGATTVASALSNLSAVDLLSEQTIPVNKIFTGILRAQGAVNEQSLGFNRLDFGVQNNTPRIVFEQAGQQNWQIDSENGSFRWYTPGTTHMSLDNATGSLTVRGALLPGTPLAVSRGGTGAVDAATARTSLGISSATWTNLTFQNAWVAATLTGTTAPRYSKLSSGIVVVEGLISKAVKPAAGETITTLPVGFRPSSGNLRFYLNDTSTSKPFVDVSTTGVITYGNAGTISNTVTNLSLSEIIFYAG